MTKIGRNVTRSQLCIAYAIELKQKAQACYMGKRCFIRITQVILRLIKDFSPMNDPIAASKLAKSNGRFWEVITIYESISVPIIV
jgi:hypothetical protein